ncbi:MAG: hypothetical protein IH624_03740 [Phycisphaerae bacterium]|nr:hypothetical protein [Phycisphaerae bacterium]
MRVSRLVAVFDVCGLRPKGNRDEELAFRVEVFQREGGECFPVVWTKKLFRVRPTFPMDAEGMPTALHDACLLHEEESLGWDEIVADSVDGVMEKVKARIGELCESMEDD